MNLLKMIIAIGLLAPFCAPVADARPSLVEVKNYVEKKINKKIANYKISSLNRKKNHHLKKGDLHLGEAEQNLKEAQHHTALGRSALKRNEKSAVQEHLD